jgi:two-component system CheB/CheR fusion protein
VGLGASAGGLEALEQFMDHVPKACGAAFVVVQHLDPTHGDILGELLQRRTTMPVLQIKDRMAVEPDHVYVIPPNKDLSILHGILHLLEPAGPRGLRLPIDFFFRALADDRQERSIGVILSGMGSDGTLGLRAIKEKAGAVFVQTPTSAKFDSMPRMVIDAGLADVIAPAEELPGKIMDYLKHVPLLAPSPRAMTGKDESALGKIIILLRGQSGHDFSLYKKNTISRRVERRMGLHRIAKIGDYVRYLRENPQESALLFKELLIGVTSFFRDAAVWERMRKKIIPDLLATRSQGGALRAWVPGCSTGEEAYTLAMVFKEVMAQRRTKENFTLQIFATDLDKDAIDKARAGVYPPTVRAELSEKRLREFFVKEENGGYRISKAIRETVIFAPQNLVMHPPFTKLDFVSCRNLLIYLDAELQKKIIPLFHYSLDPGGILVLGIAETIGTATDLFTPLEGKLRIYRRLATGRAAKLHEFPSAFSHARGDKFEAASSAPPGTLPPGPNLQTLADQLLLQRYAPAAVLVTQEGDILYVSGKTGKYLEPAAGKANWNLFAMAREGLAQPLNEAFRQAVRKKTVVTLNEVKVGTNGGAQMVSITLELVTRPEPLRGLVMVVFTDLAKMSADPAPDLSRRNPGRQLRLAGMAKELRQSQKDLQAAHDEMQTSQEELKSTNEELQSMNEELQSTNEELTTSKEEMQSMNEELQSTNEELTTSKEEMQSMNEELQTVNHEMQAKVDESSRAGNDMKNLLDSTDIAILFLDDKLRIRRFTPQTVGIIKLIPSDLGRPITDIVSTLENPGLAEATRKVMKTQVVVEKQVAARDGRWFTIRTMPYRTQDNLTDGVVITFADITVAKKLEAALRQAQADLEKRLTAQTVALGQARENLRTESRPDVRPRKARGRKRAGS